MRNVTIGGKQFQVADEPADYWGWITEGRYNHEWAVYEKYLKPEHTFVDLGAWVGAHSLYASTIAKRVIAVEPDPVACVILNENIKQLQTRWNVVQGAITNHKGTVRVGSGLLGASTTRINPNAGGGIGPWEEGQQCETACTTLRDFCENEINRLTDPLTGPLFIKMDVEGSEELILEDVAFFEEHKPTVLIELHPFWWRDTQRAWKAFEAVKGLYKNPIEVPHKNSNTWVLNA